MKHFFRQLPQANVVGAGSTSTFQVPKGPTYRSFELRPTIAGVGATEAQMAAQISRVRVKFNGIARIDISGARYITILKWYGYTIDDGVLPVLWSRPYARTVAGEENSALGTRNIETLTVEVDLDGAATIDGLDLQSVYTPEARDVGAIIQVLENTFTASASGEFEISTLPRRNGALCALHMHSALITKMQVELDSVIHFNADIVTARSIYGRQGRVPQTSVQHIEPTYLDRFDDVWPLAGVQDFRVKLTMSGAGSVPIVMETLNVPIRAAQAA